LKSLIEIKNEYRKYIDKAISRVGNKAKLSLRLGKSSGYISHGYNGRLSMLRNIVKKIEKNNILEEKFIAI
jgi:hypothetical protein